MFKILTKVSNTKFNTNKTNSLFPSSAQILSSYGYSNIYIQKDATLHNLFYLETALHLSDGTTTHLKECKQLYLQHLVFVTPLLLPAAIVEELELV